MSEEKSLIVTPAVSPEQAKEAWELYLKLKQTVKTEDDVQIFTTKKGEKKEFLKKSYWRKISKFFNLSVGITNERVETAENGIKTYFVTARATAPNGAYQDGDGSCSTKEKGDEKSEHDARATAVTRAKNRAISDLVGGGEVSAEEIVGENEEKPKHKISEPQRKRLYAIWKKAGYGDDDIKGWLKVDYGFDSTKDITPDVYEEICEAVEKKQVPKPNQDTKE